MGYISCSDISVGWDSFIKPFNFTNGNTTNTNANRQTFYTTKNINDFNVDQADKVGNYIIEKIIYNNPATIIKWTDGTKTVVKCQKGDIYSKETGLAMCICKKIIGNKGNFNDVFNKWLGSER